MCCAFLYIHSYIRIKKPVCIHSTHAVDSAVAPYNDPSMIRRVVDYTLTRLCRLPTEITVFTIISYSCTAYVAVGLYRVCIQDWTWEL